MRGWKRLPLNCALIQFPRTNSLMFTNISLNEARQVASIPLNKALNAAVKLKD